MTKEQLLDAILDSTDEGIIALDQGGVITEFNHRAKEIVGIVLDPGLAHPAGCIAPGDIVLVADNCLGGDDGGMGPEDWARLGIRDAELQQGGALLAAGVYENPDMEPVYQYHPPGPGGARRSLRTVYAGLTIALEINDADKYMSITVGGVAYRMTYLMTIGHAVIVDGGTGAVKFFQAKGYTIRKEPLRAILDGVCYVAKGKGAPEPDVIGVHITDLVEEGPLTRTMESLRLHPAAPVWKEFFSINRRPLLCSIHAVPDDYGYAGIILRITDLSELERMLQERNSLISKLEESHLNLNDSLSSLPPGSFPTVVGSSPPMRQTKYLAYKASQTKLIVLITGESGTGKSQLAREIHRLDRPEAPFVEVNCSSIPANLFESELFGYVGGAFTGALPGGKKGYFEQAEGGTLFLDEIGEIPPDIQVKLLHVLQNKSFYRIGSAKPVATHVRVLSATNKDLEAEVDAGRFREDLFYRVNVFPIQVPPLRERMADLYLLINSILRQTCEEYSYPLKRLSGEALDALLQYSWPGNIRELENVIQRSVIVSDSQVIYPEHILLGRRRAAEPGATLSLEGRTLRAYLAEAERAALQAALAQWGGDKTKAMAVLGLKKTVFYDKLKKHRLG